MITILSCGGDVYVLGEAYAFGVIWSFIFMALAVIVLRYKPNTKHEWKVPPNVRIGGHSVTTRKASNNQNYESRE